MLIWIGIILLLAIGIIVRTKLRGYFWKDKKGKKLSLKEFLGRWKNGVEGITPLQQTRTTLLSFLPLFGGLIWGIAITFFGGTYWLTLILCGSFPITLMQFVSNLQKYIKQKKIDEQLKELNKMVKK